MKHTLKALTLLLVNIFISSAVAHESHDHDAPATVKAPKGGIIKSLEEAHIEVTNSKNNIKVYVYSKDLKPVDAATYGITAKAEMPRTKKSEVIDLKSNGNFLEGNYDSKGAHRYTLILNINDPNTKHNDNLSFTIEPKK